MMNISDISFTLRITDFTGKPKHRAEALYANFSILCPLHRAGCTGSADLKGIFIGVASQFFGLSEFGLSEKDFILFSSPPKELEERIPNYRLPQLICPECGVMFVLVLDLNKALDQKARDFLGDKRVAR